MTSFILKIIGIITMLSDHIGDAILSRFSFFNLLGRISFPIFAFQAVQSYIHTNNLKKHMIKLLIFGCISQIPFMLFLSTFTERFSLNIFFTLFLGLFILYVYDKCNNKILAFLFVILGSILGEFIHVDYGAFGILLIFFFYFFKDSKIKIIITTILLCFIKYIPNLISTPVLYSHYLNCIFFTTLSLIFISFYNKKEGPKLKYFFYIFYPLHLFILYLIHMALYF